MTSNTEATVDQVPIFSIRLPATELYLVPLKEMDHSYSADPPTDDGYILAKTSNRSIFETWCIHAKNWNYQWEIVSNPPRPKVQVDLQASSKRRARKAAERTRLIVALACLAASLAACAVVIGLLSASAR